MASHDDADAAAAHAAPDRSFAMPLTPEALRAQLWPADEPARAAARDFLQAFAMVTRCILVLPGSPRDLIAASLPSAWASLYRLSTDYTLMPQRRTADVKLVPVGEEFEAFLLLQYNTFDPTERPRILSPEQLAADDAVYGLVLTADDDIMAAERARNPGLRSEHDVMVELDDRVNRIKASFLQRAVGRFADTYAAALGIDAADTAAKTAALYRYLRCLRTPHNEPFVEEAPKIFDRVCMRNLAIKMVFMCKAAAAVLPELPWLDLTVAEPADAIPASYRDVFVDALEADTSAELALMINMHELWEMDAALFSQANAATFGAASDSAEAAAAAAAAAAAVASDAGAAAMPSAARDGAAAAATASP